jgi:heat shock protein HslJ
MKQFLVLACAALLAGCATNNASIQSGQDAAQPQTAVKTLDGTAWMLPIPKGSSCEVPPMLEFEEGTVSGDLGCNRIAARYSLKADGSFAFSDVKRGKRTCGPEFMALEARMLKVVKNASSVRRTQKTLVFLDRDGKVIETLVPEKAGACE